MSSNGGERAGGMVRHSEDGISAAGTDVARTVDVVEAKNGGEAPQGPKPWPPADFGWDFPFDSPKLAR